MEKLDHQVMAQIQPHDQFAALRPERDIDTLCVEPLSADCALSLEVQKPSGSVRSGW